MKILDVKSLAIESVKVIRFARFCDDRGYFTETFRKSDLLNNSQVDSMTNLEFVQANESLSKKGVIRGLHFQWNPYMGKLVRTIKGRMVDIVLDIRKGSPTLGKSIAYDMPANLDANASEWIWVPPGFAHGNFFTEDSMIEYFCSGEYSPGCEAGISPLAKDIDWSLCDPTLKKAFDEMAYSTQLMTDKDKNGFSLQTWLADERSDNFLYEQLK
jgi:dTDP-4-dehydrorhamnose 3,5-epimerase